MSCSRETKWGRCAQPAAQGRRLCSQHLFWDEHPNAHVDPYYHEKIAKGIVKPSFDWMTEAESATLLNGRYRGDGRRLDQWVAGDPLLIDEEAFK